MHAASFDFIKQNQNRMMTVNKLRNLYSSSEKHKPVFTDGKWQHGSILGSAKDSVQHESQAESSSQEIKETLLKKIKDFRDLIHIY